MSPQIKLGLAALCLSLAACQTTPPKISAPESAEAINAWQLNGKLGVHFNGRADSAYLDWTQRCDGFEIRLSGPLGAGATQLSGDTNQVTLTNSRGEQFRHRSAEALLYENSGWHLPVSDITYWVRGLPAPGEHTQNESGFTQHGWQVEFSSTAQSEGLPLPSKLRISRADNRVTLVIKSWQSIETLDCSDPIATASDS